jgi:hypothetical protein
MYGCIQVASDDTPRQRSRAQISERTTTRPPLLLWGRLSLFRKQETLSSPPFFDGRAQRSFTSLEDRTWQVACLQVRVPSRLDHAQITLKLCSKPAPRRAVRDHMSARVNLTRSFILRFYDATCESKSPCIVYVQTYRFSFDRR